MAAGKDGPARWRGEEESEKREVLGSTPSDADPVERKAVEERAPALAEEEEEEDSVRELPEESHFSMFSLALEPLMLPFLGSKRVLLGRSGAGFVKRDCRSLSA